MAGPPFQFANHFQIVGHFTGTDINETWRSEFTINDSSAPAPADAIIGVLKDYFVHNLRSDCKLDRIEARQWSYGPQPLAGRGSLWVQPYQLPGEKPTIYGGEQAAPALAGKEVVAFVKLLTNANKPGKQFLRQLYDLGDIGAVAGSPWETLPGARVTPTAFEDENAVRLDPYFNPSSGPGIVVVHFSKKHYDLNPVSANLPFSTSVVGIELIGPTTNRPTRKNKR